MYTLTKAGKKNILNFVSVLFVLSCIISINGCSGSGSSNSNLNNQPPLTSPGQVEIPVFSISSSDCKSGTKIPITTATSGAEIRYTTDGTEPTHTNGAVYSSVTQVVIENTATVRARAFKNGLTDSNIASAVYTVRYYWSKTIGVSGYNVYGYDIKTDSLGNIFITGFFTGTVNFSEKWGLSDIKTASGSDIFITKINSDGTYGWTRTIAAASGGKGLVIDSTDNIYITGTFSGTNVNFAAEWSGSDIKSSVSGSMDIFITKINSDASYGWTKIIGGNGDEYVTKITKDNNNNIYITGEFASTANFAADWSGNYTVTADGRDAFVTKIKSDGSYGWSSTFGGSGSDTSNDIAVDNSGFVYTAGTDDVDSISRKFYIRKIYASSGSEVWTKRITHNSSDFNRGRIAIDGAGNIYFTSGFHDNTNFGSFWSSSDTKVSRGSEDVFITKIKSDGSYGWTRTIGGTGWETSSGIEVDSSGNIYVTGSFNAPVNFATDWTGIENDTKTASGNGTVFITKITSDGSYGGTKILPVTARNREIKALTINNNYLYVMGDFCDFSLNFGEDWNATDTFTTFGEYRLFLMKFTSDFGYKGPLENKYIYVNNTSGYTVEIACRKAGTIDWKWITTTPISASTTFAISLTAGSNDGSFFDSYDFYFRDSNGNNWYRYDKIIDYGYILDVLYQSGSATTDVVLYYDKF